MQIRKVVINTCFGGFSLSKEAIQLYARSRGILTEDFSVWELERDDNTLVAVVEQLGKKANGDYSKLKVVEIPADVQYTIEEYDGVEHITEVHRTWS
jgi:hypothetical protein